MLYHKTNKKAIAVLCSVIKHLRSTQEVGRNTCQFPLLLSCSSQFLACLITEQSTATAFLFVKYQVVLTFEFVEEILKCDHSNKRYRAVLSCGWVHYFPIRTVVVFLSRILAKRSLSVVKCGRWSAS